jgi:tetratricopeptide (TPR) repeat protein
VMQLSRRSQGATLAFQGRQHTSLGPAKVIRYSLQLCPPSDHLRCLLGVAYVQSDRGREAVVEWREADNALPYIIAQVEGALVQDDLARASKWLSLAHEVFPGSSVVHHYLGIVYAQQGHPDLALDSYRKAVDAGSWNGNRRLEATTHYLLGEGLSGKGEWQQAAAEYTQAVDLAPRQSEYRCRLAWALYRANQNKKTAQAQLRTAVVMDSNCLMCYRLLVDTHIEDKHYDEALAWANLASLVAPQDILPVIDRGKVYFAQEAWAQAKAEFAAAARMDPNSEVVHYWSGRVYAAEGHLDEAIGEYTLAIKLAPDVTWLYAPLGDAYLANNEPDKVVTVYHAALQAAPAVNNQSWFHNHLGRAYQMLGQREAAREEFRKAFELSLNSTEGSSDLTE